VSNSGTVTGESTGTATITATSENRSGAASVTVIPLTIVGTVSGRVSVEGTRLAGVTVELVGPISRSTTTGAAGNYLFADVPAGTYGVQINGVPADVILFSASTVVTITASGEVATANFGGTYIRTSSIRGNIATGTGTGIVATVSLTGVEARAGNSDTNGNFEFADLRAGDYTVTISNLPATASFTVTSRDVSVAVDESAIVRFVGTVDGVAAVATVAISSITASGTDGVPVVPSAVAGAIDVNLIIDEGTETVTQASVLLDGVSAGTQFSPSVHRPRTAQRPPPSWPPFRSTPSHLRTVATSSLRR
jgi:hypothetical protein